MSDSTSSVLGPIPLPTAVPSQVEPEPAPACRVKIHVRFLEEAPPSGSRPPLTSVIGRHESAVLGTERSPHLSVSEVSRGEQDARLHQTLPDALRDLSPLPLGTVSRPAQCVAG